METTVGQLGKFSDIHPAFKQQKCRSNPLIGSTKTKATRP